MRIGGFHSFGEPVGSATGTPMNAVEAAAASSAMDAAVGALRAGSAGIRAAIEASDLDVLVNLQYIFPPFNIFEMWSSTAEARANARSVMNTIDNGINRLDTESRQLVLDGQLGPERWVASAKILGEGMPDAITALGDGNQATAIKETLAGAYKDLVKLIHGLAGVIPKALELPWGWILGVGAGLIVLGYAFTYYTTAKRVLRLIRPGRS